MFTLFLILFIPNFIYFILQIWIIRNYKPYKTKNHKYPKITVLVPVYNQGKHIKNTLKSLLKSKYQKQKLELIVINDGSKDDTLKYIEEVESKNKGRMSIINLEKNQGKRNALLEGYKHSSGQIIVTVDSDTTVFQKTLKQIAKPFMLDKKIRRSCPETSLLKIQKIQSFGKMLDAAFRFRIQLPKNCTKSG